jgi:hypothetical protein
MRTLIISDVHRGSLLGSDVLRRLELREPLFETLADVDRLILLGDVLELRHGPVREVLASAARTARTRSRGRAENLRVRREPRAIDDG